jgi:hypothetical protein
MVSRILRVKGETANEGGQVEAMMAGDVVGDGRTGEDGL